MRPRFSVLFALAILVGTMLPQSASLASPTAQAARTLTVLAGAEHDTVTLYSFFPESELDDLLGLEARLRWKIAQANAAVGVETVPIPGAEARDITFADAEEAIKSIADEDTGVLEPYPQVIGISLQCPGIVGSRLLVTSKGGECVAPPGPAEARTGHKRGSLAGGWAGCCDARVKPVTQPGARPRT